MLKRKLAALGHPNPDEFDVNDETEFRSTVLWLEDQKIRHYKIEDREGLRQLNEPTWNDAFSSYLRDLDCPVVNETPTEQLMWLASFAIRLEYADNANRYNTALKEKVSSKKSTPNVVSSNPLDNLDFSSEAFKTGVGELATIGFVGPHPDPRVRLSALATVLNTAPHPDPTTQNKETIQGPSDVMKLLFINELRTLQTSINEALVAVQKITADPRTDTSLGKVGF